MARPNKNVQIILAEFDNVSDLLSAAAHVRDAGYKKFDCHSPFEIGGLNEAMGIKRSGLGYIVGLIAIFAIAGAYLLQWWTQVVDYPLVFSGKPFNSFQAYLPVTFALAVLFSGFTALFGMLALNKLPRYNHPLFSSKRFDKSGDDGFFISIDSRDPEFDPEKTKAFLESIGGKNLEVLID